MRARLGGIAAMVAQGGGKVICKQRDARQSDDIERPGDANPVLSVEMRGVPRRGAGDHA
jgi:hypothetical protein